MGSHDSEIYLVIGREGRLGEHRSGGRIERRHPVPGGHELAVDVPAKRPGKVAYSSPWPTMTPIGRAVRQREFPLRIRVGHRDHPCAGLQGCLEYQDPDTADASTTAVWPSRS